MERMTVLDVLQSTTAYFKKRGIENPRLNAEHLLAQSGPASFLTLPGPLSAASGLNADEFMDTQVDTIRSILTAGEFPVLGRLTEHEYDFNLDTIFEFGLQRLLDGYAVLIDGITNAAGAPSRPAGGGGT